MIALGSRGPLRLLRAGSEGISVEDLFFAVHLYALLSSGIDRTEALRLLSSEKRIYTRSWPFLAFVSNLARGWGYDLAASLSLASRMVRRTFLKGFFTRLSQVVGSGADLLAFLRSEIESLKTFYTSQQDRVFEAARLLFNLFTTFTSASVFMVANMAILAMLLGAGDDLATISALAVVIAVSILGLVVVSLLPKDPLVLPGSSAFKKIRLLALGSITASTASLTVSAALSGGLNVFSASAAALPMALGGRMILRIERKIEEYDRGFPTFLKGLGHLLSAVPDIRQSLSTMLMGSLGALEKSVVILRRRLLAGVQLERAWQMMIEDLGSRQCFFSGRAFAHAFVFQGDVRSIGDLLGEVLDIVNDVRRKRSQMARAFEPTVLMVHALTTAILGLMSSLLGIFSSIANLPGMGVIAISPISPAAVSMISTIVVTSLSIINGVVSRAFYPGSLWGSLYHVGIMLLLGWTSYAVTSTSLGALVQSMTRGLGNIPGA